MSEKTEAFIISKEESGDSSYVVTFYSKLFGKINLFVKSARTSKKRFQGKLESGNLYEVAIEINTEATIKFTLALTISKEGTSFSSETVSYTHLTLPTKRIV